jgi:hypothetical protein
MAQVVGCLPRNIEALSLIPSTTKEGGGGRKSTKQNKLKQKIGQLSWEGKDHRLSYWIKMSCFTHEAGTSETCELGHQVSTSTCG